MGEGQAASLLRENLEQEQNALREVEQVSQKLTRELVTVWCTPTGGGAPRSASV